MPYLSPSMSAVTGRGVRFLTRLGAILSRLRRGLVEPWRRRAAIRELERIGARALRDAGIEPYEIKTVVDAKLAQERREAQHVPISRRD